jgi:uncharacterized iron-regulated protein
VAFRRASALLLSLSVLATGCGARGLSSKAVGYDWRDSVEPAAKPKPRAKRKDVPPDTVENSALPFHGLRARDCQPLSGDELMAELAGFDAICIGERHDNPHDHWAQLEIATDLVERAESRGRELAFGFEMFDRSDQPLLAEWQQGKIDTEALIERSNWQGDWGYPFGYYRPLLELGRGQNLGLLALNAPREFTRTIARRGLEALDDDEQRELPELDLSQAEHRAAFDQVMKEHPHGGADPDNLYAAQVVWDETMAHDAAAWLRMRRPARQLVIIAGQMHCRKTAVPDRIARRTPVRTAAVLPVVTADGEAKPDLDGFDYGFVMTTDE